MRRTVQKARSVYLKRALPDDGGLRFLTFLTWLLASLATAVIAHGLIDFIGAVGVGGDAYDDHPHGAVAPVALGAVAVIVLLLLRSVAIRIGRARTVDPAMILAARFGSMSPVAPAMAVTWGGFLTLIGMEFSEQFDALGRIAGIADALGGNPASGFLTLVAVAVSLTGVGLRFASAVLRATVASASALAQWVRVKARPPVVRSAIGVQPQRRRRTTTIGSPRALGLRAPPAIVA